MTHLKNNKYGTVSSRVIVDHILADMSSFSYKIEVIDVMLDDIKEVIGNLYLPHQIEINTLYSKIKEENNENI